MSFLKKLKNPPRPKARSQVFAMAEPPRRLPPIPGGGKMINPFRDPPRGFRPMPTAPSEAMLPTAPNEAGLMPLPRPRNKFMPGRFRPLPQIIPERMPSRRPTPRFFGGGLGSILERIFGQLEREDELRRLPFREDMPMERFPMMRPQFAAGDEVDMDMMIADQAAREGISPAEQRMMMIQQTAADMGRTISDRDAQLFGIGEISFEEAMSRSVAGSGAKETMEEVSDEISRLAEAQSDFALDSPDRYARISKMFIDGKIDEDLRNKLYKMENDRYFRDLDSGRFKPFYGLQQENLPMSEQGLMNVMTQSRNQMQQEQLGFAAGDEVDVAALPKGLKAMYDSGPKGREGVEKIAAKTDKFAEGGAVESEIDKALEEIQGAAPDAMVIQQVMTMVMEMIQSGASEEQIVAALKEMGLDDEDIQQVMMMVAEEMAGQESIDGQLAQMM